MDGREEMYGETFFKSYVQTMAGQGDWQQRLQVDNVDVAILQPHEGLAVAMSQADNWRQVFQDAVAVVYERVPPDTGSLPSTPAQDAAARR
jgi:hypothetical protein